MSYQVRCINCDNCRIVTEKDVNEHHTPKSKATTIQKRAAEKCDNCNHVRFGIKEVDN